MASTKKTTTKTRTTGSKVKDTKRTTPKKAAPKKATSKAAEKNDGPRVSEGGLKVLAYLTKAKATEATKSVDRKKVLEDCGVTLSIIATLKKNGLMDTAELETGKAYHLTKEGVKAVS